MVGEALRWDAPTLGDILALPELLSVEAQARLRLALAAAGWASPGAEPLGRVALGDVEDRARRRGLRSLVEAELAATLDSGWAARLAGRRLADLVPPAGELADGPIAPDACGPRLLALVQRNRWSSWETLLDRTVAEVWSTHHVGARSMAELLGMCVERSLEALATRVAHPDAGDLALVLGHERGRSCQPLLEALLELRSAAGPAPVRDAADRLVREAAPWALDAGAALEALAEAAGDGRARAVFAAWSSWREPASAERLAALAGASPSRANHIAHQAGSRLRAALVAAAPPLPWLVAMARRSLGTVTTEEQAGAVLGHLGLHGSAADLALWLAGPYRRVASCPGWVALEPRVIVSRTAASVAGDGGVRRLVDVEAELTLAGETARAWLRACGAAVVHDLVVSLAGPLASVVERVLDAHGQALPAGDIAALVSEAGRPETTAASVAAATRRRRFTRRRDGSIGLAEWKTDAASPSSPQRAKTPKRTRPPAAKAPAQPASLAAEDPRLWLWVRVDAAVLRGDEAVVPAALAAGLGVVSPARRTFSSRYGPVVLACDGPQPVRGSCRAIALAAGAGQGDTLLLGFSGRGDVAVEVRHATGGSGEPEPDAAQVTLFPNFDTGGMP